jgi:hypothetical protein
MPTDDTILPTSYLEGLALLTDDEAKAFADERHDLVELLRVPDGIQPFDRVEWMSDLEDAALEAAGLTGLDEGPLSSTERARIIGTLSGDDVIALVQGRDLPKTHPFLLSIRATAAA